MVYFVCVYVASTNTVSVLFTVTCWKFLVW